MKNPIFFLLFFFTISLSAEDEKLIDSQIQQVTVFTSGAQVQREAKVLLTKGINVLVYKNLSPDLDERSIQFNAKGDFTVLSLKYEVGFDENSEAQKQKSASLNQQLKTLDQQYKAKVDLLAVAENEEQVLMKNTGFGGQNGVKIEELQKGVEYVKTRLTQIRQEKRQLNRDIDDINKQRQEVLNKLQEMRIENSKRKGSVIVKLNSEINQEVESTISYVIADAGWEPYYDFRVKDISQPLQIGYKAKVHQNSGEDWNKVKLTLSTGNPYEEGKLPELDPWFLNFMDNGYYSTPVPVRYSNPGITGKIQGVVLAQNTDQALPGASIIAYDYTGNVLKGITSNEDGSFTIDATKPAQYITINFVGYNVVRENLIKDKFYTIRLSKSQQPIVLSEYDQMALRDISSVASQAAGVTSDRNSENIRGSRDEGTAYYIDGTRVRGNVTLPKAAISQQRVEMGGLPAQYGNASEGVISSHNNENPRFLDEEKEFKISQNPVNLKFQVETPYDIPSNGQDYKVAIKDYQEDVHYHYEAVPKLNENAFLTASFTGWEDLNLLNGSAGIYYEGTYLGETFLNVEEAGDTLQISLGKDENVKVHREAVKQSQSRKFLSNKVEQDYHYKISVRNTKPVALEIKIEDQYPVSANSDITVERVDDSDGKVNDETGMISWEFTLQPKEQKDLDLIYQVKFPKGKRVNLR